MKHTERAANILRSLYPLLPVAWTVFVFSRSMQNGTVSGAESGAVLAWLETLFTRLHIPVSLTDFLVRKGAHFAEYGLLGVLMYGEPLCRRVWGYRGCFAAWFCCFAVAAVDEGIQYLTPGRACRLADVLLDSSGAAWGVALFAGLAAGIRAAYAARTARRADRLSQPKTENLS